MNEWCTVEGNTKEGWMAEKVTEEGWMLDRKRMIKTYIVK